MKDNKIKTDVDAKRNEGVISRILGKMLKMKKKRDLFDTM